MIKKKKKFTILNISNRVSPEIYFLPDEGNGYGEVVNWQKTGWTKPLVTPHKYDHIISTVSGLCCLYPHIEIGASYPFSLHQRSPPTPFLTIKHTQYLSQIRSSKHSPLFLGESFWLLQSQGFTPREDKFDAHKCDFFSPLNHWLAIFSPCLRA